MKAINLLLLVPLICAGCSGLSASRHVQPGEPYPNRKHLKPGVYGLPCPHSPRAYLVIKDSGDIQIGYGYLTAGLSSNKTYFSDSTDYYTTGDVSRATLHMFSCTRTNLFVRSSTILKTEGHTNFVDVVDQDGDGIPEFRQEGKRRQDATVVFGAPYEY